MLIQSFRRSARTGVVAGIAIVSSLSAFSQVRDQAIVMDDGTVVNVSTKYNLPIGFGPQQVGDAGINAPAAGLAFYSANYISLGTKPLPFNIVGTDPSLGANTTIVPTAIVPLKFVFPNPGNPSLDGTNVVVATQNSPIFQFADYTAGGVDIGFTQYGDAIQRAQFWNIPGFSQAGYHVLLGPPAILPTVTVVVPTGKGNAYNLRNGGLLGVVDDRFFGQVLAPLLAQFTANQLPIFLTDNVFLGTNGVIQNCCVLGYHASQGPPISTAKTWIYAAHTEPGSFRGDVILDVQPLSHEVAEWLNDPFVGTPLRGGINLVPPTILPGQGGACIINFEDGDPLEAPPIVFTKTTNGTTYHLQDEVFLPWYLHTTPSFSVNNWYTFLNTFTTPGTLCGPG